MTRPEANRILHVPRRFSVADWGGTETVVVNLCREQAAAGFRPEIHTSKALCPDSFSTYGECLPIHRYGYTYPYLGLSPEEKAQMDRKGGNVLSLSLFASLLKRSDVRIYHAHALKRLGGEVLTAARLRGKPCVVSLHGNYFDVPEAERQSMEVSQKNHFEWGRAFGALFQSRSLLEKADAVICVGFSEYEKACEKLDGEKCFYLPNGIRPESFSSGDREGKRRQLGFGNDDIVFGCISRIDPQKDQVTLIKAFARTHRSQPAARLLIAGPVTDPLYEKELHDLAEDEGIGERVTWLPPVKPESGEHASLLAALDCFVLPSRHEPFGIVVLEAWAADRPVITSDAGGLARLVSPEVDGLTFPAGSVEALTHSMTRLIELPGKGRPLAQKGKAKAVENFTWKRAHERLEEIYRFAEGRL